jgi:hypothetical protein
MDGMQMMLKSFGIDPEKIKGEFLAFQEGVKKTLAHIDGKLTNIEKQNAEILAGQSRIEKRQEEIWQMNQTALSMSSQVQLRPAQPPTVQQPPNDQPITQPSQ